MPEDTQDALESVKAVTPRPEEPADDPSPAKKPPAAAAPESESPHAEDRQRPSSKTRPERELQGHPSTSIESNEKAAAELLVRIALLQAKVKKETGRFVTAQQILSKRRPRNGTRLRGNRWAAQGYRFVLETPKSGFYFAVAVPITYGKKRNPFVLHRCKRGFERRRQERRPSREFGPPAQVTRFPEILSLIVSTI